MHALANAKNDNDPMDEVSPYLRRPLRRLNEACRAARLDDNGRRCPSCSVRDFCERQTRLAVAG